MSFTEFRSVESSASANATELVTIQSLQDKKSQGTPIVALTAYDYATARVVDEAGVDVLLVGDSLAMVVMGYETTLPVTVEEMLLHTQAVRRAVPHAGRKIPWMLVWHLSFKPLMAVGEWLVCLKPKLEQRRNHGFRGFHG